MANRFLNNITINDEYTLPSADGTADQIITTDGAGQLSFADLSSIDGAASNFVYFDVKNETGSTISKGKGVMAVGTDGNSGHILIDEMVADGTVEPKYFLGVLEEDIANGAFTRVISFGQLDQFNTNGQNGETWADGQVLWCDPANPGDFTITEPDGPNVKIAAAFILNKATNGKIQVRVQANEGIHDLHDTKITSQVDGDVLVWDNTTGVWFNDSTLNVDYTNGRVGIGTDSPGYKLDVNGNIRGTGVSQLNHLNCSSTLSFGLFTSGVRGTIFEGYSTNSVVRTDAARLDFYMGKTTTGVGTMMSLTDTGRVGIGTTSPGAKLDVSGRVVADAFRTDVNTGHYSVISRSSAGNATLYVQSADSSTDQPIAKFFYGNTSPNQGSLVLNVGKDKSYFTNTNVGIGTTSPSEKLEVAGNLKTDGNFYLNPSSTEVTMSGNTSGNFTIDNNTGQIAFQANGSTVSSMTITSSQITLNEISQVNNVLRTLTAMGDTNQWNSAALRLETTNTIDTTGFQGLRFATSTVDNYGWRVGANRRGNGRGSLRFYEHTNSIAGVERFTIAEYGNVGIGTDDPSQKLDVVGSIEVSDGIYLGGTAAANKLDDYEEGSFTPSYSKTDNGPAFVIGNEGRYTKIGDTVHIEVMLNVNVGEDDTYNLLSITNLPFTVRDRSFSANATGLGFLRTGASKKPNFGHAPDNGTAVYLFTEFTSGYLAFPSDETSQYTFTMTYKTTQ